jgi:hypothetical protein
VNKVAQLATYALAAPNTPAAAAATPVPITALPRGIHSALISPDGSRYAVLADPRLPDPLADEHSVIEAEPTSLYVINADGSGGQWWCPTLRNVASGVMGGGLSSAAWSLDGSEIALLSQTPKIGFHDVRSFLEVCSAKGPRHVATINNLAAGIAWIDGGKELAFLSTTTPVLTPDHVWTVAAAGAAPVDRTPKLKGSALGLSGDAKGNAWVLVARGVQGEVDALESDALVPRYRWPAGTVNAPVGPQLASAQESLAFTVGDPEHASNVAVAQGSALEKITNEGDDLLSKIALWGRYGRCMVLVRPARVVVGLLPRAGSCLKCWPRGARRRAWLRIPARHIFPSCGNSGRTCSASLPPGWLSTTRKRQGVQQFRRAMRSPCGGPTPIPSR